MSTFGSTIGSGGPKIYDSGHEVSYNHVQGVYGGTAQGALLLDSAEVEGASTNLAAHWRVVNALVERNVLVGNPTGIVIGNNYSLAPTGCTIRDNVVAQATTGVAVTQLIAPVSSTLTNNAYYATPATSGLIQGSDGIWRKPGYGPRLTYLQASDVGPNGDLSDTDGTGTLIPGAGGGGTVDDGTAATKLGWGAPLGQSDEFEYTGAPNSSKWGVYNSAGHDGNGVRSPSRVTVANGKMILTGLDGSANTAGLEHKLNQTYGRWECRVRSFYTNNPTAPGNQSGGYHPVLIIWSDDASWPRAGEYDFYENGEPGEQSADGFMHYPSLNGTNYQVELPRIPVDLRQFHNIAFEWTADGLTGWIDGVQWFAMSGGAVSGQRAAIQAMPSGHLTVQLDAFQATGCIASTMELEWVRVYSLTPSGGTAGPQTVSAVGIGSVASFGIPFLAGGGTAPPPNTVPTQLGVNTVLGSATLGYTALGGSGGGTPGNQSVRPLGIPSAQAFGVPVLSVADGPITVAPVGIATAAAFGRPTINPGSAPPPAPGGTLVPALFAVSPDGGTLVPLPAWTSIKLSPVRNSSGSLEITYPAGAPGFDYLHDNVSASPLRALEVRVWLGGSQESALGGWLVQKSGDDLTPGSSWTFSGHFHEWLLTKAIVAPQEINEANKSGALTFAGATAGLILSTLMDQAQARGALPLVTRSFTAANDSDGVPWAKAISSLKLAPKTTVYDVATKLVELGMCEFTLTPGRVWHAYNPEGRGVDRTVVAGGSPLTFAHAVNLSEHSRRESARDAGTAVLVAGAEGFYKFVSSPTAQAQLGWRAEVGVDAGQLNSQDAIDAVAPTYLQTASTGVAEYAAAVEFGPGASIPLIDYGVGDWAYTIAGTTRRRLRIAQIELEFARDKPADGKVVFNDLITDRVTALYRRLNAISTGDAVVGTSESTPGGAGADTIPPAAPQGLTVSSSFAYQVPGEPVTRAEVSAGWAAVINDAYATQEVADKAWAAAAIADWIRAGRSISATDLTWSGCPTLVTTYGKALYDEWKASPDGVDDLLGRTLESVILPWLLNWPAAHAGGGAVTGDVANYRVQYTYLGGTVANPGQIPPDELEARRLAGDNVTDYGWIEPSISPTTTTFATFADVIGGRAVGVRVRAVDQSGNQGPWSGIVGVTTAVDDVPPPIPSKLIAVPWFETANVTWDGKGSSGEDMIAAANDFLSGGGLEIHMGLGIDFPPDRPAGANGKVDLAASSTYKTTLYNAGTTNVTDLAIGTTYFFRAVAVDRNGNASDPSETSDGVLPQRLVNIDIGPNAIAREQIIDGEIVNAKIADLAVNDAKISNLSVGKLTAGTMLANVVIGGMFQTPINNGNQIQLDPAGLRMYRGGTVVGRWQVADSSMLMTGQMQSAVTGQRLVINPGGGNPDTMRIYPSFSEAYSSITAVDFSNGTIAGIQIVGSGTSSIANRGQLVIRDQYASLVHGRTDLSYWGSEIWVEQSFTRNKSGAVDLVVDERLTPVAGPRRVAMIHYDSSGFPINATGLYYKKTDFNGGEPQLYGNGQDVALIFGGGRLVVSNNPNGARRGIIAAEFIVESSQDVKYGFRSIDGDPTRHLRRVKPTHFKLRNDPDGHDQTEKLGFVAEEMPSEVRKSIHFPGVGDQSDRVIEALDYNAITALLWGIVQRIDRRLTALEAPPEPTA